ncbi:MAG: phosphoesterase [Deltaproteobacteria bacterium]|nr:MAG: phosphoesterase [Deltaproteobacteria bacterium]
MVPEELLQVIREQTDFLLLTHVHPDGDALGSMFGLAEILRGMGKNALCFTEEPVSHLFDFLPDCRNVSHDWHDVSSFAEEAAGNMAVVAMDCGDAARLGKYEKDLLNYRPFLVIDHHKSHQDFGSCNWVEPDCSSTGEMIFELAGALGAKIPYKAAFDLYTAILTDTGSFRYECTSPRTLQIASELLAAGVRPEEVASKVYDNYTKERLRLMEMVLATLELYADEQLAVIYAAGEMFEQSGASYHDTEGLIDFPRSLKSVKAAVLIKEAEKNMVSVSLRAKGECDVAEIAGQFGGGGHRNAAGCRFTDKSLEQVKKEIIAAFLQVL